MNHYVYEITNNINGKKYIGKRSTHTSIDKDNYWGSGIAIKKAIEKYGKDNFSKTILHICNSEEEAYCQEELEIERVKAYESDLYYNITKGGVGVKCGNKKDKSLPPDFQYRPTIFDINEYITTIIDDFDSAEGYALFKIKYLCGYLFMNQKSKEQIIDIIFLSTEKYYTEHSFTKQKWLGIIENAYNEVSHIPKLDLIDFYTVPTVTVYKSEIEKILMLNSKFLRKSALVFLVLYKFHNEKYLHIKKCSNEIRKIYNTLSIAERREVVIQQLKNNGYIELNDNSISVSFAKFEGTDILASLNYIPSEIFLLFDLYNNKDNVTQCHSCNRIIKNNKNRSRLYCDYCNHYKKLFYKTVNCVDCGAEIVVKSRSRKLRCDSCQKIHNNINKKNWRNSNKNVKVMQEL